MIKRMFGFDSESIALPVFLGVVIRLDGRTGSQATSIDKQFACGFRHYAVQHASRKVPLTKRCRVYACHSSNEPQTLVCETLSGVFRGAKCSKDAQLIWLSFLRSARALQLWT